MALSFSCPEHLTDCDCSQFPVRNFSQEEPDVPVTFCDYHIPPDTGTSFNPDCVGFCESEISEDDCIECAQREAVDCSGDPPTPPQPPNNPVVFRRTVFTNDFQSCTVECADGTQFTDTVAAGTVNSFWQADANARAQALACKHALEKRLCFTTESPLSNVCVGVFSSIVIGVAGGTSPYTFAVTSGSVPTGMTFDSVGLLSGTPTTSGTSTFEVTVTDAIGSTQTKEFTLLAIEITSPSSLPDATLNSAYSETLTSVGNTFPVSWAITAGALPTGLSMPATGVISGTPTVEGPYSFTATLTDADGDTCSKDFTIEVTAVAALEAYWTFESITAGTFLEDSTANNLDIDIVFSGSIVAGKVGNCYNLSSSTPVATGFFPPALLDISNGITIAGWIRTPDFQESTSIATIFLVEWGANNFLFEFDGSGNYRAALQVGIFDVAEAFSPTIDDNGWHFYRVWYDPTDGLVRLQIDSGTIHVSVDSIPAPAPFAGGDFSLGGGIISAPGDTRQWDETGIWMRVLSTGEGDDLWNGGAGITFGNPDMPP